MAAAAVALGGFLHPHQQGGFGGNNNFQQQPHHQQSTSASSKLSATVASHAGKKTLKTFQQYLPPGARVYSCAHCRANLANHTELISKSFQGSQGKAYLFDKVVNIICGPAEERVLLTGLHAVADIREHAYESSQKYKEGKYIIELVHMVKDNGWDNMGSGRKRFKRNSLG